MQVDRQKMDSVFESNDNSKPVGILLQHAPDPDCLGAAAGFSLLLDKAYGLSTKIFHFGEVSHPQNKSMVNILHIKLFHGNDFDPMDVCKIVVLDTDLTSTGFKRKGVVKADVRIDHHAMDRDDDGSIKDVRQVGSTCAIVWEYLKHYGIDLEEHEDVATALVLGIKTDTLDFTSPNTSELDIEAFRELLSYVDKTQLARVTRFPLPKIQFELESKAFDNKEIKEGVLVSFIGEIIAHNRDIIATIADRFARMDTVHTVVILGIIDNDLIASVRSDDSRVNVSSLCADVFGKEFSGAKEGAGGARVPLGTAYKMITDVNTKEQVMLEIVASLKEDIFKSLGEE